MSVTENKSKKRGKFYTRTIELVKPANSSLESCEECGEWPARKRFYSHGKVVCDKCARKYWNLFLAEMTSGAGLIAWLLVHFL